MNAAEFWADAVKRLKRSNQYSEAAAICRHAMPAPAAYREVLVCLRKLVGADAHADLLLELYRYAIEADFLNRISCVEIPTPAGTTSLPAFNVAEIVWGWLREEPLRIDYQDIGYERVTTLNKSDRRRLAAAFGEPRTHRDPCEEFRSLWDKGVAELARREEAELREMRETLKALRGSAAGSPD